MPATLPPDKRRGQRPEQQPTDRLHNDAPSPACAPQLVEARRFEHKRRGKAHPQNCEQHEHVARLPRLSTSPAEAQQA
jgi:hypothetical protein